MELQPIGIIHSPYQERQDAPRQGRLSDKEMTLEIFPGNHPLKSYNAKVEFSGKIGTGDSDETINLQ